MSRSKYTTIKELGRGGFGVVDEVVDATGNTWAKKTFQPSMIFQPQVLDRLRKRFIREARHQEELGGREIVPIVDHHLEGDTPWFIMPLAEKTYEVQIQEDRASGAICPQALGDILNSLEMLHTLGYVHRDLNPKNILLYGECWKLSDLGAILPPGDQTVTLTEGTIIYTERYCAPEQRREFHQATPAADVYAFGCILHDLYDGGDRTPYAKHTSGGELGVIIEKCTEQAPERRPNLTVLRDLLLNAIAAADGLCGVDDAEAARWLERLDAVSTWTETEHLEFARYFASLSIDEREAGHENEYVQTQSTPFLTRIPAESLKLLAGRNDGASGAILEKYCTWAGSVPFVFQFADTVSSRLVSIFDNATPSAQALAFAALVRLGSSHNRWHVMQKVVHRCKSNNISDALAKRIAIELKVDECIPALQRCVRELNATTDDFAQPISALLE